MTLLFTALNEMSEAEWWIQKWKIQLLNTHSKVARLSSQRTRTNFTALLNHLWFFNGYFVINFWPTCNLRNWENTFPNQGCWFLFRFGDCSFSESLGRRKSLSLQLCVDKKSFANSEFLGSRMIPFLLIVGAVASAVIDVTDSNWRQTLHGEWMIELSVSRC